MNHSLWIETTPTTRFPRLYGDLKVDVAIVGGGVTGLLAAAYLHDAGKKVAVIEMDRVAMGETGHTTAHLTEVIDTRFKDLIHKFNVEDARTVAESGRFAIDQFEAWVNRLNIPCGFERVPAFLYSEKESDQENLAAELHAAKQAGVDVELTHAPLGLPFRHGFQSAVALRFANQAQFHPRQFLLYLVAYLAQNGVLIFEDSKVTEVEEGEPCHIHTQDGSIQAKDIILAAHVPFVNRFFLHTKLAAYRSYAVAAPLSTSQPVHGLFWDCEDPYHYIRAQKTSIGDMLIVGGSDHKTGQVDDTESAFKKLENFVYSRFGIKNIAHRWSGQIIEPVDGLPYIGHNTLSKHIYVATGYTGNGMTFGMLAGFLLAEEILGRTHAWAKLYKATRIHPVASAKEYLRENIDFPTYYIKDRVSPPAHKPTAELQNNEGQITEIHGQAVALYKDFFGKLHALSPACPHMGCYVHWNNSEKSWDCPCHGSRFDPLGKLLNGPAVADLTDKSEEILPEAPQKTAV